MALGKGMGVMGRGADLDVEDINRREKLAQQLYMNSIVPQQPERSWTQGAARLAQSLASGFQQGQAKKDREAYTREQSQGMDALLNGNMTPEMQSGLPFNLKVLAYQMAQQQKEHELKRQDKLSDMQNQLGMEKQKMDLDPIKHTQGQLLQLQNNRDMVASAIAQEQDPERKKQLADSLGRIDQTIDVYSSRIPGIKGDVPDLKKAYTNDYLRSLPNDQARAAAIKIGAAPAPETAIQKTIGEGVGKNLSSLADSISNEAKSSADSRRQGEQILQMIAANPNLQSGPGTQTLTNAKSTLNSIFPGAFDNLSEQQMFQKGVGGLSLEGIGRLKSAAGPGLRVTQNEIQSFIPLFTPSMLNSVQGIKTILEHQGAMDPALQKGSAAINTLLQRYTSDPSSMPNIAQAINDVKAATQEEVQRASIQYMNSLMNKQGKKIVINPSYDPIRNPINKYIAVPLQDNSMSPQAPNMGM